MHKKLHVLLGLGALLALAACSGDDDNKAERAADGGTGGAGGSRSSAAGSGKGTGSGKEGVECKGNSDCGSGLSCLNADANVPNLKVCARPCGKASDCDDGEFCSSVKDGDPEQALCWKKVSKALEPCGPAFTSMCDDSKHLGCLRFESEDGSVSAGVCLEPCKLKEKDACGGGLACFDIIDMPDDGLCVQAIKRGDECDEASGKFCETGNLCLGDEDDWRCYQDCTDSKKCDDGKTCKPFEMGDGGYCE